MSRGVAGAFLTLLGQPHVVLFPLIVMEFDSGTQYICGAPHDVAYGGNTYLSLLGLGTIEPLKETDAQVSGMAFTLSAVPGSALASVLQEDIADRRVSVRLAALSGTALEVDENVWQGLLDVQEVDDQVGGSGQAVIRVSAEHRLAAWDRPRLLRNSPEDQARLSPTDKFFEFVPQMAQAQITWPGKEFFEK